MGVVGADYQTHRNRLDVDLFPFHIRRHLPVVELDGVRAIAVCTGNDTGCSRGLRSAAGLAGLASSAIVDQTLFSLAGLSDSDSRYTLVHIAVADEGSVSVGRLLLRLRLRPEAMFEKSPGRSSE